MAENTLPFIKGVKNKQGQIVAEFSDPKLPISMSGVEGLQEGLDGKSSTNHTHSSDSNSVFVEYDGSSIPVGIALNCLKTTLEGGKADKITLTTTMGEHSGGIPTFTGLDDKTESQVCLIEITTLGGAVKQGGLLIVQNATSVYSQTIIAGTDIYVRIYQGGYWHEWDHRTIPATHVTLPIEISDVTNLQTALSGKLNANSFNAKRPFNSQTDISGLDEIDHYGVYVGIIEITDQQYTGGLLGATLTVCWPDSDDGSATIKQILQSGLDVYERTKDNEDTGEWGTWTHKTIQTV